MFAITLLPTAEAPVFMAGPEPRILAERRAPELLTDRCVVGHRDDTEVGIFEATVEFYFCGEIFRSIFIVLGFCLAILMVLAVWTRFFNPEYYRNHPQIWYGDGF